MANRFRREPNGGGGVAVRDPEREDTRVAPIARSAPGTTRTVSSRTRAREEFGGISWGAALLGYLTSFGLAALLVALLSSAGAAIGLTKLTDAAQGASAKAITLGGAIGVVVALCAAYFIGGYAAGRMSRFDGLRQGVAVWLWGLLITAGLAVLAYALGDQYNVLSQLDLPRIPVGDETLTTGGLITIAAALAGTLLAAMAGGRVGEGFHRRVDRYALEDAAAA